MKPRYKLAFAKDDTGQCHCFWIPAPVRILNINVVANDFKDTLSRAAKTIQVDVIADSQRGFVRLRAANQLQIFCVMRLGMAAPFGGFHHAWTYCLGKLLR
jgi:hypothetical protein